MRSNVQKDDCVVLLEDFSAGKKTQSDAVPGKPVTYLIEVFSKKISNKRDIFLSHLKVKKKNSEKSKG